MPRQALSAELPRSEVRDADYRAGRRPVSGWWKRLACRQSERPCWWCAGATGPLRQNPDAVRCACEEIFAEFLHRVWFRRQSHYRAVWCPSS